MCKRCLILVIAGAFLGGCGGGQPDRSDQPTADRSSRERADRSGQQKTIEPDRREKVAESPSKEIVAASETVALVGPGAGPAATPPESTAPLGDLKKADWTAVCFGPDDQRAANEATVELTETPEGLVVSKRESPRPVLLVSKTALRGDFRVRLLLEGSAHEPVAEVGILQPGVHGGPLRGRFPFGLSAGNPRRVFLEKRLGEVRLLQGSSRDRGAGAVFPCDPDSETSILFCLQKPTKFTIQELTVQPLRASWKPPAVPVSAALRPDETLTRLPAPVTALDVGGSGRYLALLFGSLRRLAIFDVAEARIRYDIPVADEWPLFAAGKSKLVVIHRRQGRWELRDLPTGKQLAEAPRDGAALVHACAIGAASEGPLITLESSGTGSSAVYAAWELVSPGVARQGPEIRRRFSAARRMVISADGQAVLDAGGDVFRFGVTKTDWRTGGSYGSRLQNPRGFGKDWRAIFGHGWLFDYDHRPASRLGEFVEKPGAPMVPLDEVFTVPSIDSPYFLALPMPEPGRPREPIRPVLCSLLHPRPLVAIEDLKLTLAWRDYQVVRPLSVQQRLMLSTSLKRIVTLPVGEDVIVTRRFDVLEALDESPEPIVVTSDSPSAADETGRLEYRVEVYAKNRPVDYELISPPEGMTISPDGVVRWQVPEDSRRLSETVRVNIIDGRAGDVDFYFTLQVRKFTPKR